MQPFALRDTGVAGIGCLAVKEDHLYLVSAAFQFLVKVRTEPADLPAAFCHGNPLLRKRRLIDCRKELQPVLVCIRQKIRRKRNIAVLIIYLFYI